MSEKQDYRQGMKTSSTKNVSFSDAATRSPRRTIVGPILHNTATNIGEHSPMPSRRKAIAVPGLNKILEQPTASQNRSAKDKRASYARNSASGWQKLRGIFRSK